HAEEHEAEDTRATGDATRAQASEPAEEEHRQDDDRDRVGRMADEEHELVDEDRLDGEVAVAEACDVAEDRPDAGDPFELGPGAPRKSAPASTTKAHCTRIER